MTGQPNCDSSSARSPGKSVVADEMSALGDVYGVLMDVSQAESVDNAIDAIIEKYGKIDVLVNNAGNAGAASIGLSGKPFWEKDPAEWEPFL